MHYPRVNLGNIIRENGAGFYIFNKISQGHSVMKKVFCIGWLKEQKDEFFRSTFFRGGGWIFKRGAQLVGGSLILKIKELQFRESVPRI